MNQKRLIYKLLALVVILSLTLGCGFGIPGSLSATATPTLNQSALNPAGDGSGSQPSNRTANPISVKVSTDESTGATALITTAGGSLSATAADGTVFTLTLPAGALPGDEQITLTPVTSVAGLPFSGGLVGPVQMTPEGLRLFQPATLTIDSFRTVAAQGFETVAFAYHQSGEGLYLNPSAAKGSVLMLEVWHFSGAGAAQGTLAEIQTQQQQHVPSNPEDAFTQQMQQYERRERQTQLMNGLPGQNPDPQFGEKMDAAIKQRFESWLELQLAIALKDCKAAPEIIDRRISHWGVRVRTCDRKRRCLELRRVDGWS